jgi:DUF1680 family protein
MKIIVDLNSTILKDGKVRLNVVVTEEAPVVIKIRIPDYTGHLKAVRDGKEISLQVDQGYACLSNFKCGENLIEIDYGVKPRWIAANVNVRADEGKVALVKGPCVYCLEELDNGDNLGAVYVNANTELQECNPIEGLFGDIPTIEYGGIRLSNEGVMKDELYGEPLFKETQVKLKAIPYCLWSNRGTGEMLVWHKVRLGRQ